MAALAGGGYATSVKQAGLLVLACALGCGLDLRGSAAAGVRPDATQINGVDGGAAATGVDGAALTAGDAPSTFCSGQGGDVVACWDFESSEDVAAGFDGVVQPLGAFERRSDGQNHVLGVRLDVDGRSRDLFLYKALPLLGPLAPAYALRFRFRVPSQAVASASLGAFVFDGAPGTSGSTFAVTSYGYGTRIDADGAPPFVEATAGPAWHEVTATIRAPDGGASPSGQLVVDATDVFEGSVVRSGLETSFDVRVGLFGTFPEVGAVEAEIDDVVIRRP